MKPALTAVIARQVVDGEMPIVFAARMPAMRPDSIAAMRAVAMLVAVWLATLIPVRRHRQAVYCMVAV
jgi:hypothetical protein